MKKFSNIALQLRGHNFSVGKTKDAEIVAM